MAGRHAGAMQRKSVYYCMNCNYAVPRGDHVVCGNKPHYFPSTGEYKRFLQLKRMELAAVISNLALQTRYRIHINGKLFCTYVPDFEYDITDTGEHVIEDYKGSRKHSDTSSKLRRKAAELYHGINVTLVGGK